MIFLPKHIELCMKRNSYYIIKVIIIFNKFIAGTPEHLTFVCFFVYSNNKMKLSFTDQLHSLMCF